MHWQLGLVRSLLGANEYAAARVVLLCWIGAVAIPACYVTWRYFLPQTYENVVLRCIGIGLCLIGLFARRFSKRELDIFLLVALSYLIPFFFTFMFLMNHASAVWTQTLLVGLVVLFHFDMALAGVAYAVGTALACVGVLIAGEGAVLLSKPVLQQLPIHWFTIAELSVAKVGRNVLAQEKLAGLGAGLATVAHELRTPLTSVDANARGLNRLLQHDQVNSDSAHEALTRIQFEVRHMNHMIDLFLLSASAVNRNLQPNEAVSMAATVDSVIKRYPFAGQLQQNSVVVEVRGNFMFAGQSELAVVILLNLLRNALKAVQRAGKGRVRIIIDGARRTPRLLFIDTGCGIAPRHLPLIFQRFYSYPAHNGTGIGLALCKEIVEAWQARIRCVSRETAYAIFVLEFPLNAPARTPGTPGIPGTPGLH
ncbi:sensor histidine kinase [Janthinobacterium sp. CG3]|uniref:sensor histidine kinase n=1 Tax=Janthinobacterium sp. CG3 TaxID=1075768 RepID=UPI00034B1C5E|nr:HAMP domain-containing sensor histidine kinase [Janthinobacterium sp. CG3]